MRRLTYILFFLALQSQAQFLHQQGTQIVEGNGKPIILRGLGLGGWMLQEGYMLKTADFAGPQYQIREKIEEVLGPERTEQFYQAYRDNGITKRDIDSLRKWGFNSIRLPMHYKLFTAPIEANDPNFLKEGFKRTDDLLEWCKANRMYLILDMHGTPGGQGKDANISDYDTTKPSLWESKANRDKLVALWKELAGRYKNETWIGAYDLINEPNWAFTGTNQNGCDEKSNAPLRELYVELTKAIREVDKNHLIIIEGNCWGNNYNGIFPLWDQNMALSFHKYWNGNTQGALQTMLDYREKYQVPIWLGESGENSNQWFAEAITLVEKNGIGWAWWPMKKIQNVAGIANVRLKPGYQELLNYWIGKGPKPDPQTAFRSMMEVAENYKLRHTTIQYDVIDAMFRQPRDATAKAYAKHVAGQPIAAAEYDFGGQGTGYSDTDYQNLWVDSGQRVQWNKGHAFRNDGVDVYEDNGQYVVGDIRAGEWLRYSFPIDPTRSYSFEIEYSGPAAELEIQSLNGEKIQIVNLPETTGFQTVSVPGVRIPTSGLRLHFLTDAGKVRTFQVR